MKAAKKFVCLVLAVLVLSVASAACAATFTFSNSLNQRAAIALTYVDASTGAMTTKGWWHVEPNGSTSITVNADESRGVYYAAYNDIQFLDSSMRGNPQIRRWASQHHFTYATDAQPNDATAWHGRFFRIDGNVVNIDRRW